MTEQEIADYRAGKPLMLPTRPQQPSFTEMSADQRARSLDAMVRQIEALTSNIKGLGLECDAKRSAWTTRDGRLVRAEFLAFHGRSFLARLRWLVTGK